MTNSALSDAELNGDRSQVEIGPSGFPLKTQALIDALIDIDLAYEREGKEISNSRLGATRTYYQLERLREQHRQRREPYVQQLIALQNELTIKGRRP